MSFAREKSTNTYKTRFKSKDGSVLHVMKKQGVIETIKFLTEHW